MHERLSDAIVDHMVVVCRTTDDDDLPPMGVLEHGFFQQAVEAACAALNEPSFEVTPTLVMLFKTFLLFGASYFDVVLGLLPVSIISDDGTSQ
jgi:hypothetical protein